MSQDTQLTVPGRYDQIRLICEFVAEGARIANFDDKTIFHIELACDEACTNIIEHAYEGEDRGDITVSWEINDHEFVIILTDTGQPFDPEGVPEPPAPDTMEGLTRLDNLKVGGLGLHFMKKLMDDVRFAFAGEKGNRLTMIKQLKGDT